MERFGFFISSRNMMFIMLFTLAFLAMYNYNYNSPSYKAEEAKEKLNQYTQKGAEYAKNVRWLVSSVTF
jgi:hypothetical protein